MKKRVIIVLTLMLIFVFTSCTYNYKYVDITPNTKVNQKTGTANGAVDIAVDKGALKNGTYEGKGDVWEAGNESAIVIVEQGKISQVTLRKLDTTGEDVNYDEWTGVEIQGKKRPNLKQYREDMAKAIIQKQSTEVDDIAGATVSSKNWKIAVDRALEQAEVK